jgi:hypothetical protein
VNVLGGITDTQFVYEEMRLEVARHRKMPATWRDIRITHLGGSTDNVLVANESTLLHRMTVGVPALSRAERNNIKV